MRDPPPAVPSSSHGDLVQAITAPSLANSDDGFTIYTNLNNSVGSNEALAPYDFVDTPVNSHQATAQLMIRLSEAKFEGENLWLGLAQSRADGENLRLVLP